jgi:hypothetical protein
MLSKVISLTINSKSTVIYAHMTNIPSCDFDGTANAFAIPVLFLSTRSLRNIESS